MIVVFATHNLGRIGGGERRKSCKMLERFGALACLMFKDSFARQIRVLANAATCDRPVLPSSPPETRPSLILRLPDARDAAAWDEVASVYGPLVFRLARRKGLQPADADDLVQEVLAAVARSVEQWLARPDRGRFRAWLLRIARNTAINFLTRSKYRTLGAGGDADNILDDYAAPDDRKFDVEYRRETFRWAARQVRESVTEKTWQAFWQTTMDDRTIADVAEELEMTVGSVYIARSRVMARLRELVNEFERTP